MGSIKAALTGKREETMMSIRSFLTNRTPRARIATRIAAGGVLAAAVVACVLACGKRDDLTGVHNDPNHLYWSLTFNYHGVTLSTDTSEPQYHTLQLVATPRTVTGEPIEGLGMPTFTSSDTTAVVVDSTGLITARKPKAAPVLIVARLASAQDAVTNYDTAYVVVTAGVNPPTSFEISAGRTTYGIGFDTVLKAHMTDAHGDPLTGVKVLYSSSDPGIASIDSGGVFQPKKQGTVKIAASTISYGAAYTDTLELTIGPPEVFEVSLVAGTNAYAGFNPTEITIKAGQGIAWNSSLGTGAKYGNVTFDSLVANIGPSPVDGATGNIPPFILKKHIRMFPIPGTYTYSNTLNGDKGKVIVVP
jgi:hypothetical protein